MNNHVMPSELPLGATPSAEGVEIRVPEQAEDTAPKCENCGSAFARRKGSGGKRFCSAECRQAFHASEKPNVSQCGQRATLETPPDAIQPAKLETATAATAPDDSGEFDWSSSTAIVLREQPATAVYLNPADDVVIRQLAAWDREEDSFVYVRPEHAVKLCKQILKVAGFGDVDFAQRVGGGFVDLE
jgi:hypothetical protein